MLRVKAKMHKIWLSVLGSGFSPVMPGTCGSAVTASVFLLAALLSPSAVVLLTVTGIIAIHGFVVTAVWGDKFISQYGPDPGPIVSDAQCGQAITYLWLWPVAEWSVNQILLITGAGFLIFRCFDIIKPPPVRQLEQIHGVWGIVLDDVMAGIYALICLQVLLRFVYH